MGTELFFINNYLNNMLASTSSGYADMLFETERNLLGSIKISWIFEIFYPLTGTNTSNENTDQYTIECDNGKIYHNE